MHINEFKDFLRHEKRASEHTIIAYQNDLKTFGSFIQNEFNAELVEVNYQMVRSWIVNLMDQNIGSKSVNRKISSLKSFYKFLLKKKVIKVNPLLRIQSPKIPKRLPNFVEEKRMENLFSIVQFSDDFEGLRDRLMLELFYVSGMRLSELINLKLSDFNGLSIKVMGKGNKERIIPITQNVLDIKNEYYSHRENRTTNEFVFVLSNGKKMYAKLVYNRVNFYLAQVTSMKKKSPHILRHTFATHLLNNGAEINAIKELLGHSSLAATQVYTHNSIEKLKNIYTNTHPLAG